MATIAKTGHDERTASEPRHHGLHVVTLAKVTQVNSSIRTFRLRAQSPVEFNAGQWLDTFLPGLTRPGGFTITSAPAHAATSAPAQHELELAVQRSDDNPAAAWLWQPASSIVGRQLVVRVGGSFVWPPPPSTSSSLAVGPAGVVKHVLFVAGGVGVNPLVSMVRQFEATEQWPERVTFLYASKVVLDGAGKPERVLFLGELRHAAEASAGRMSLRLFLTGQSRHITREQMDSFTARRINEDDLTSALERDVEQTVCYVCGVPSMTDLFVRFLAARDGMTAERVLCEKWW